MDPGWSRGEPCVLDDLVPEFLADYLTHRLGRVDGLVDLWAGTGRLLGRLAARLGVEHALGVCSTPEVAAGLRAEAPDGPDWRIADPSGPAGHLADRPDVVVGVPPWHWAPRRLTREVDGRTVHLTDDPANVAMLDACRALGERGIGCFLVGPGVLMRPGPGTVMARLGAFGLHVDGVVEIPRAAIRPDHGPGQILLMLSRTRRRPQILGRLDAAPGGAARLLGAGVPVGAAPVRPAGPCPG